MSSILTAKPVNVQCRFRGFFVPPMYDLYKVEVSAALATRLAETYGLKSTDLIINQNSASSQYVSFRYFLQGEPFRYMDVFIGIDQAEVVFSNPGTVPELMNEVGRVWRTILEMLKPVVKGSYFESTLHCETEKPGAIAFLNEVVRLSSDMPDLYKGFSVRMQVAGDSARLNLDVSESVQNGLYVSFAVVSTALLRDIASLTHRFETTLAAYRQLQDSASIQILERNTDGTYAARN